MRLCAAPMLPCPRICPMKLVSSPWRMPCSSMGSGSPVLAVNALSTALDGITPCLSPVLPDSRLRRCCWFLRRHGSISSSKFEQDLSAAIRFQRLRERFLERVEWVDLLHCGPQRSLSDEVAQLLVHLPDLCTRRIAYPIDQPEAVEAETTVDELAGRHGRKLPTEEGVDDNRAASFERLGQLAHGSSAHRIEDETQFLPVESLFNLLVEVVALENHAVTSPLPHLVDRFVPADDMQRLDACALRERDDVLPHGRVGGGLADPVTGHQRNVSVEQERGRRRVDPEHGELQGVGVVTHRHDVAHRDDHRVRPCPLLVGRKHQDALPLQSPIDLRAHLGDAANTRRAY